MPLIYWAEPSTTYCDPAEGRMSMVAKDDYDCLADRITLLERLLGEARPAIEHWGNTGLYDRCYAALNRNPICPVNERMHGVLGSGCTCGHAPQADPGEKYGQ